MNISQLEYYIASVESGSYASASKKLYVNPSTISLAVSHLEKEMGVRLLNKSSNGVVPTTTGKVFYEQACLVLTSFMQLCGFAAKDGEKQAAEGILSIALGASNLHGPVINPNVLLSFEEKYPNVVLKVYENASSICVSLLEKEVVDAAITLSICRNNEFESSRLFTKRVSVIINDQLCKASSLISFENIQNSPIAMPADTDCLFAGICNLFAKYNHKPRFEYVEPSPEAIRKFVQSKNGVVFYLENLTLAYPDIKLASLVDEDRFSLPVFFMSNSKNSFLTNLLLSHIRSFRPRANI